MSGVSLDRLDEAGGGAEAATPLVEVLDRLLARGVVLRGEVWLSVADVDLVFLGLDLFLASPDTMRREGRPGRGGE